MARTSVQKAKVNLPANINEQLAVEAAAIADRITAPSGNKIMVTQSKTFRLPDGREGPGPLTLCVVNFVAANYYYTDSFDRNDIKPPHCFAASPNPKNMQPVAESFDAQSEDCATCWANQFGSAGKGKACQNTRVLAVLPTDADMSTPLQILRVSPTGIRHWDAYVSSVADAFKRPEFGVITEVSFDSMSEYPSLRFKALAPADNDILQLALARRDEAYKLLMTAPDMSSLSAAPPPAVAKAPKSRAPARTR